MTDIKVTELEEVTIRFSGDSGDGMQLTGSLFSDAAALFGNDVSTFPDYPSEIRAPQGTVAGVSGFQVQLGARSINTPGDLAHILVAMNPAAVKANARFVQPGGVIIFDADAFTPKNLEKAGFTTDTPFKECGLDGYNTIPVPVTTLTKEALAGTELDNKAVLRSKNMFALGLICWMFGRELDYIETYISSKFGKKQPAIADANYKALHAGYNYGMNMLHAAPQFIVHPADIEPGLYRSISGNQAAAYGFIAAAEKAGTGLFLGSYPITPATDILVNLAERKDLGVKTFQAEDEIAGICAAVGAAYAGHLAITSTSGPGFALKSEALGLSVMAELPLVVVNVQRGGPSTGLPTKTEQSDLLQTLYGRNGESPVVVIAASTPSNCFYYAFMAAKIALERMVPVVLLSDGFLGNGSEPWRIPAMSELPPITPNRATNPELFKAYARNAETMSRQWAVPGQTGFEHLIGGLEKNINGGVSHDPTQHQSNVLARGEKVKRVADMLPALEVVGPQSGALLVVSWGGTYGHTLTAVRQLQKEGKSVSLAHFNYINPLPTNTAAVFARFSRIVVCELNMGQFATHLRSQIPDVRLEQINQVSGLPFSVSELKRKIDGFILDE
jgi:2-oxoglutarate ferredoxin oxidoreductase subunit alpha